MMLRELGFNRRKSVEPPAEWIKNVSDFKPIIGNLTQNFIGRKDILDRLVDWAVKSHKNDLFVLGPPGIGKSALAARCYQMLDELPKKPDLNIVVAAFFADKGHPGRITPHAILRHLAASACKTAGKQCDWLQGDIEQILNGLESLIKDDEGQRTRQIVFIIDGFDELNEESQKLVRDNAKRLLEIGIKVCICSQKVARLADIEPDISLEYDDEGNLSDLRLSTEADLSNLPLTAKQKDAVAELIIERAKGQFLYKSILISLLAQQKISVGELRKLPVGIQRYYESLLDRLKSEFDSRERFLERGLPLLTLLVEYGAPVSIGRISGILGFGCEFARLYISILKPILKENDDDSDPGYEYCHQSVAEYLKANEDIAGMCGRVAQQILRYEYSDCCSEFVLEKFVEWAQDAKHFSAVRPYLENTEFV